MRIRLPIGQPHPALLVIDRAIGSDQGLKYVYVVDAQSKIEYRRVETGSLESDGLRVITKGLKPDELVVVGGLQQVHPHMEVKAEVMPMPSLDRDRAAANRQSPSGPGIRGCQPAPVARRAPQLKHEMISHFFIDRPIFATVLSIVITLTGGIALLSLPIAQYPQITPPAVSVSITYPGASAQIVADTVAAPIEQQVNGVEGMLYMSSQSGNDGTYTLTVTFDVGTDLNTALVMVQNRVMLAMPLVADAGPEPGDHDPQADARHPDDRQSLQPGPPLRRPLSEQLRRDPPQRRGAAGGRRGGFPYFRRARLQHPRLARSAKDGRPAASMPATWRPPSRARTWTCPPGSSARRPRPPASPGKFPSMPWAASASRSNSATSSSRSVQARAVPMSTVAGPLPTVSAAVRPAVLPIRFNRAEASAV